MVEANMYKSVLKKLSDIPIEYLSEVDKFLTLLRKDINTKGKNREEILKFAGSWSDMKETDFNEYMDSIKELRSDLFSRDIEL